MKTVWVKLLFMFIIIGAVYPKSVKSYFITYLGYGLPNIYTAGQHLQGGSLVHSQISSNRQIVKRTKKIYN